MLSCVCAQCVGMLLCLVCYTASVCETEWGRVTMCVCLCERLHMLMHMPASALKRSVGSVQRDTERMVYTHDLSRQISITLKIKLLQYNHITLHFTALYCTVLYRVTGLLMLGQSDSPLAQKSIPDLLNYSHDTSHEKIVRCVCVLQCVVCDVVEK